MKIDKFVVREVKAGNVTYYEIGATYEPRICSEWCDVRVCEGFWGNMRDAYQTVNLMNLNIKAYQ